jgi:hypothetical protein
MKKTWMVAAAAVVLAVVSGCFESKVPMASSDNSKIEPKLTGTWVQAGDKAKKETPWGIKVAKFNKHEYFISFGEVGKDAALTRAWSVAVGNVQVMQTMNVQSIEDDERTFLFFKYAIGADGALRVQILDGGSPLLKGKEFKTSAEFMGFMEKNIDDKTLFGEPMLFKKTKDLELCFTARDD